MSTTYTGRVASVNPKGLKLEGHEDKAAREKARKRAHYLANREAYLARAAAQRERLGKDAQAAYNREYREQHAERLRVNRQEYYQQNRARLDARNRAWWDAQGDRLRTYTRDYYQANRERIAAQSADWKRANMDRVSAYNAKRRARRLAAPLCDLTRRQWDAIKRVYRQRCAYCGDHTRRLTMDHVIPVSRNGSHTARNVVPACRPCNARKRDRAPLPLAVLPSWPELAVIFGEGR